MRAWKLPGGMALVVAAVAMGPALGIPPPKEEPPPGIALSVLADAPPVITGEDDFGTTSAYADTSSGTNVAAPRPDTIIVIDPGPGDGKGPK